MSRGKLNVAMCVRANIASEIVCDTEHNDSLRCNDAKREICKGTWKPYPCPGDTVCRQPIKNMEAACINPYVLADIVRYRGMKPSEIKKLEADKKSKLPVVQKKIGK
jgi:hypothetical protein